MSAAKSMEGGLTLFEANNAHPVGRSFSRSSIMGALSGNVGGARELTGY